MTEIKNFNVQCFIDAAKELLRADETIRALNLLDNLPAFYRDNIPVDVLELKLQIQSRIATSSFYANDNGCETAICDEIAIKNAGTLRGRLITKEVQALNGDGIEPHVVDAGPGEYWLPMVLQNAGCKFTYEPIYLNKASYEACKHRFESVLGKKKDDAICVYVACEIIEHLWNEADLKNEMLRYVNDLADIVHVSTPLYTFDPLVTDWETIGDLGHLRAYTPQEFQTTVMKIFPEYLPLFYRGQIQHARLTLSHCRNKSVMDRHAVDLLST